MRLLPPPPHTSKGIYIQFGHRLKQLRTLILLVVTPIALLFSTAFTYPQSNYTMQRQLPLSTAQNSTNQNSNCAQPLSVQQLAQLSNADLAKYGLPLHDPKMSQQLWFNIISHAKHRICSPISNSHVLPAYTSPYNEQITWTGNIAYGNKDAFNYKEVYGTWVVPCVANDWWSTKRSAIWVGLGGDDDHTSHDTLFLQGGSLATVGYWGSRSYSMWYENFATGMAEKPVFSINCGDTVFAEVYQSAKPFTVGAYAYIYLADWTLNKYSTSPIYNSPEQISDGTTAEWVEEAPCSDSSCTERYDHAKFSSFTFESCTTVTSSGQSLLVGQTTHNYSIQTGMNTGNNLSNIGPIYPSGYPDLFNIYWNAYN